ncbi:MAG: trypsin-like peptidase domain-containing protein [Bacteroidales bacterium]|nr:trypsin-like peptidase domain-containing protein [Bacteroidales bacterium]
MAVMLWQIHAAAKDLGPWSLQYRIPALTAYQYLAEPEEDIRQVLDEESRLSQLKTRIYAVGISTDISPSVCGQWDSIAGAGYVWRTGIHADKALSLNLLLENFHLEKGEHLYVYNEAQTVLFSFDTLNNHPKRVLPVASVEGNTLVVEWNIPSRAEACPFVISNTGYGFRDAAHPGKLVPQASGNCNIDVNCKTGNHWQQEKRAVVLLQTLQGNGNWQYCTGVLLNQTGTEKKPYILTAGHCVSTDQMAANTVFRFEYEKITCESTVTPPVTNLSGAQLLAFKKELDFALLELSADIPETYHPYYAGWNVTGNIPSSGVCIHHPSGDVKKISVEKDPLSSATYNDGTLHCDSHAHWLVQRWDEGVTEDGSSGSPLFDDRHLVVGTLTGGDARCKYVVNDYYAKISQQWNKYNADTVSLKKWLDPGNTGVTALHGYDPATQFSGVCDTLSHVGRSEPKTVIESDEWGVITGHSDKYRTEFAERFGNDTVATVIGVEANIARVHSTGSQVRFSVWTGDQYPETEIWGKDVFLSKEYGDFPLRIYTDRALKIPGNFFVGYAIGYATVDTFAVYQSIRRPYEGISAMYTGSGGTWNLLSEATPPIYSSLAVKALGKFGQTQEVSNMHFPDRKSKELEMIVHPGNEIFAYFEDPNNNVVIECFDTSGKRMSINETGRHLVMRDGSIYLQIEINAGHLPHGIYILRVQDQNKAHAGKFVKR